MPKDKELRILGGKYDLKRADNYLLEQRFSDYAAKNGLFLLVFI